ncbi:hypothetical protein FSP39_011528 [Pinctada imbricata]|uniref:RNA-directed DNA polymerase n=1 Tax=Pinctada imbricata TaxID=66713 RepID=A0AA88XKG1_PINIB|nr:hypothetical protein FSP39_011528 [Pinctada imbricata]
MNLCVQARDQDLSTKEEYVRRQLIGADGVYVQGRIQGIPVEFVADTGAVRTILSDKVYQKIPASKQPVLFDSPNLTSVNGDPLRIWGKSNFPVQMGKLKFQHELIVAEIDDECLLGLDILCDSQFEPTVINLGENIIKLNGIEIPCSLERQRSEIRQVTLMDDYVIPAKSEIIVKSMIDQSEKDMIPAQQTYIIEANPDFEKKYGVSVASTLVDSRQSVSVPVRILNLSDVTTKVSLDDSVGHAEKCGLDQIRLLRVQENGEDHNFFNIRSVQLGEKEQNVGDDSLQWQKSESAECSIKVPPHLKDLYDRATEGKNCKMKAALAKLLEKHADVFSENELDLGRTNVVEHSINTGNSRPLRQPPRKVPLAFEGEEKKAIDTMMKQSIIQKSTSPWASPIVLVKKKNGKVRPCIDYRRLNAVTTPDAFPLPRVQDCLDTVRGSVYFSTFDITSGYHQVPVKKEDVPKTAFVTKYGLYEFKTMPMGLSTASATFQRLMELVLQGLNWTTCIIYLDDIVCFATTFEEHMVRVDQVLASIGESGLKLKPEKCSLLQDRVNFLGHVVSKDGILPSNENVAKILKWTSPKSVTEIRQFLGMTSYYRRFIKDYAIIARPLINLTKRDTEYVWDQACQESFEKLKRILASPEIMAYPREDKEFILDCDASGESIGAVLSQIIEGKERVISYGSRALSKAEKNYCITDKELLAVRHFIEYYKQYLMGRKFLVRTDHQALVWLFKLKEPKDRTARWLEILSAYNFEVQHRPGEKHGNADGMSRCKDIANCECEEYDNMENLKCGPCRKCLKRMQGMNVTLTRAVKTRRMEEKDKNDPPLRTEQLHYTNDSIKAEQLKDKDIGIVYDWVKDGERPNISEITLQSQAVRHYWHIFRLLEISNGILVKRAYRCESIQTFSQIIAPKKFQREAMVHAHDAPMGGHLGRKKTKRKSGKKFLLVWYGGGCQRICLKLY